MKDSGVEWIGEIPEDWKVGRVKNAFFIKKQKAEQDDPVILSLARDRVKVRDISSNEGQLAESYYNYNPVSKEDFLLNPMDLYSGANCNVSRVEGVISPAYVNLRYRGNNVPKYFDYYFKTQYWAMALFAHGKGVSFDNRWTLNAETLMNYFIPLPSTETQSQIASYLDQKTATIDHIIEKTKESIEDYKLYKQSLISEAVTKGLDPDVKFKDSGSIWLQDIPYHWQVSRVGLIYEVILGKMLCPSPPDESYTLEPYYCAADISFEGIADVERRRMWFNPFEKERYLVREGDLLVVEGGSSGTSAIAGIQLTPTFVQNSVLIIRFNNANDVRYLRYLMEYLVEVGYIENVCNKATIFHLTREKMSNIPLPVFPQAEQKAIADYLDLKTSHINKLVENKEQLIEDLEAYKKSLIYEVVTGKREVQ
jgi:type I restriction enzyme S subunit